MSLSLDRSFVLRLSDTVQNLTQKSDYLFNLSCPLCGDSRKSKLKARGYFYKHDQMLLYHCHNCNRTLSLRNFLKEVAYSLYSEYLLESLSENKDLTVYSDKKDTAFSDKPTIALGIDIALPKISSLSFDHFAKAYVRKRKIPEHFWDDLYYAKDYKDFILSVLPHYKKDLYDNDKRLVIPCRDEYSQLIGFQGRSLDPKNPARYITMKVHETSPKIYGIDRIDPNRTIYVTEGPIDAMFLSNCVGSLDSNLLHVKSILGPTRDYVFVFDNEQRNANIIRGMNKAILEGNKVVIWPEYVKAKDINDMVLEGLDVERIIKNRTYEGLKATIELGLWKR